MLQATGTVTVAEGKPEVNRFSAEVAESAANACKWAGHSEYRGAELRPRAPPTDFASGGREFESLKGCPTRDCAPCARCQARKDPAPFCLTSHIFL